MLDSKSGLDDRIYDRLLDKEVNCICYDDDCVGNFFFNWYMNYYVLYLLLIDINEVVGRFGDVSDKDKSKEIGLDIYGI